MFVNLMFHVVPIATNTFDSNLSRAVSNFTPLRDFLTNVLSCLLTVSTYY